MSRRAAGSPLDEVVPVVAPLSIWEIERRAERFLEEYQPDMLRIPQPFDVRGLVDYLPTHQIRVSPATVDELGDDVEAITRWPAFPEIEILVIEEQWSALWERANLATTHRAHATLTHELGHALLHAEQLHVSTTGPDTLALQTQKRSEIPAFKDPEWQAWAWAGFVLMPRSIVTTLDRLDEERVAELYDVSPEMARHHLRLLVRNRLI